MKPEATIMPVRGNAARTMPEQANKGGAARGLDRAGAMSGRTMPTPGGGKAAAPGQMKRAPAPTGGASAMPMMKKGGAVDGIAKRGKTQGTMVKMAKGGKAKRGGKC